MRAVGEARGVSREWWRQAGRQEVAEAGRRWPGRVAARAGRVPVLLAEEEEDKGGGGGLGRLGKLGRLVGCTGEARYVLLPLFI